MNLTRKASALVLGFSSFAATSAVAQAGSAPTPQASPAGAESTPVPSQPGNVSGQAAVAPPATAAPDQTATDTARGVGDIIVTAQRRSQRLQSVPISITAVTASQVQNAVVQSTQDLVMLTPGLTLGTSRNSVLPFLRGVGTQSGSASNEGSVAVYVDNVYIPTAAGSIFSLNSIDRVEVLKGPQGTLFGRNSTGGLIHVITREPGQEQVVNAQLGYGNYNTATGSLYLAGPIAQDLYADLAVYGRYQGDGWGHNFVTGADVNLRREIDLRSKLLYAPSDRVRLTLIGDYSAFQTDIGNTKQVLPGVIGFRGTVLLGTIYDANSPNTLPDIPHSFAGGVSLTGTFSLSDAVKLTSITAYRFYKIPGRVDNDVSPFVVSDQLLQERTHTFQQEVLLNGTSGPLNWTTGIFFYRAKAGNDPQLVVSTTPANNFRTVGYVYTHSIAGYAQGELRVADDTHLTLGIRYTDDRLRLEANQYATTGNAQPVGTLVGTSNTIAATQTNRHYDAITWRAALDHKFGDVLGYVSVSRGYKGGAFSTTGFVAPAANPETLYAYEVGFKSDLFDRTLRLNASAFYYDYRNIQLQAAAFSATATANINATSGKIKGLEAEMVYVPSINTGHLEFRVATTFLDAHYGSFPFAPLSIPQAAGGNIITTGDATGHNMVRAPKFSSSASIDYSVPVASNLRVGANVAWQYSSRWYFDPENRLNTPPLSIINGNISLGSVAEDWRVSLWVKNLLDKQYFTSEVALAVSDSGPPAAPRTFGVMLDKRF